MEKETRHPHVAPVSTRRAFLQRTAGTGLATVAGVALIPRLGHAQSNNDPFAYITLADQLKAAAQAGNNGSDVQILNFALTLERLEATFYNTNASKEYLTNPTPGTALTAIAVGSELTPAVNTNATALARFTLSPDRTQLFYDIRSTGLSGEPIAIRLNRGLRGATGDIAFTLAQPVNGVSTGVITVSPADVDALLNQGLFLNIATAANPNGELRGQVIAAPPGIVTATTPVLKSIVDEIRDHENAHVSLLEGALGASANPAPQFQNLDAPTLQQFLTMAQTFEDIGVSAYLGQTPLIQDKTILATAAGIMDVEARHAGGLRAYRKVASAAEGGDANITLTEDRESVNRARTRDEVLALIQPFIAAGTTPPTTPVTNPTTGTGNGTGTGTTPNPGGTVTPPTSNPAGTPGTVGPTQQA